MYDISHKKSLFVVILICVSTCVVQIAGDVVEAERVVEEDLKDEIDEAAKEVKDEIPDKVSIFCFAFSVKMSCFILCSKLVISCLVMFKDEENS